MVAGLIKIVRKEQSHGCLLREIPLLGAYGGSGQVFGLNPELILVDEGAKKLVSPFVNEMLEDGHGCIDKAKFVFLPHFDGRFDEQGRSGPALHLVVAVEVEHYGFDICQIESLMQGPLLLCMECQAGAAAEYQEEIFLHRNQRYDSFCVVRPKLQS
jgi:hypothetical protein